MTAPVDDLAQVRRQKLEVLRGKNRAYPHSISVTHTASELFAKWGEVHDDAALKSQGVVRVAGRVSFVRRFGKAGFAKIRDRSGVLQVYVAKDKTSAEGFLDYEALDLADTVVAEGVLFRTKTGELSVEASSFQIVAKCLRNPPEKFHGLSDLETRYRKRYVDLMTSDETRSRFLVRSQVVQKIREFFLKRAFVEVETPMMHSLVTGAAARPFKTHHNTLDMQLFLRIAPELYLKRLVVGGMERVFEINRNFRNEGISPRHNPEFTMLEFYQSYATFEDLMDTTEELVESLAKDVLGKTLVEYQGQNLEFARPWKRITLEDSIREFSPYRGSLSSLQELQAYLKTKNVELNGREGVGALLTHVFDHDVQPKLIQPTFVTSYPVEVSPLARRSDQPSASGLDVTDRFELFVHGNEIANGFNELNDPDDQKARFLSQLKEKDAGNDEATDYDADYIEALEYGLPPTAGEGIGIDRLVMLLTNAASIRDVILFPQLRPEKGAAQKSSQENSER